MTTLTVSDLCELADSLTGLSRVCTLLAIRAGRAEAAERASTVDGSRAAPVDEGARPPVSAWPCWCDSTVLSSAPGGRQQQCRKSVPHLGDLCSDCQGAGHQPIAITDEQRTGLLHLVDRLEESR